MDSPEPQWQSIYTLRDVTAALFRQKRFIVACFVLASAAVAAFVFAAPKVYDADLKILVKRDRADTLVSGTPEADRTTNPNVSEPELLSEVELLQGRDLLEQVAVETGLAKPAAAGSDEKARAAEVAGATDALIDDLTVEPVNKTWMIGVTYSARDPLQAKQVLDTLARLYLEKHLAIHRPPGAYQFFSEQTQQAAEELRLAKQKLQEFSDKNRVVSAGVQKENLLLKLTDFEGQQRASGVALAEAERRVSALESEVPRTSARRTSEVRTMDSAGLVQEMQSRILTLELRRTELLQKFTPQYRGVREIDEQLAQTRTALESARKAPVTEQTVAENPTMQWIENEIARARTERAAIESRRSALTRTVDDYRTRAQELDTEEAQQQDLLRDLKSAEEKFLLYQRKQEEARISDALDRTRIANVAIAQAPTVPFEPRRTRSLLLLPIGLIVALVLSLVVALIKDALSSVIRTPDELQSSLGVPVLAWVPAGRE